MLPADVEISKKSTSWVNLYENQAGSAQDVVVSITGPDPDDGIRVYVDVSVEEGDPERICSLGADLPIKNLQPDSMIRVRAAYEYDYVLVVQVDEA